MILLFLSISYIRILLPIYIEIRKLWRRRIRHHEFMKKRKNDPFFSQPIILPLIPQHIYDFLSPPHKKDTEGSKQSKQASTNTSERRRSCVRKAKQQLGAQSNQTRATGWKKQANTSSLHSKQEIYKRKRMYLPSSPCAWSVTLWSRSVATGVASIAALRLEKSLTIALAISYGPPKAISGCLSNILN